MPIPPQEANLPTITAEYFVHPGDKPFTQHLEGTCFDRNGDLYFTVIGEGKVGKVDMKTGEFKFIYDDQEGRHPVSVRIHKNGKLYVSCFGEGVAAGVLVMDPDGTNVKQIIYNELIDDLIFDKDGGFYYTVCTGYHADRSGFIGYCTPSNKKHFCVIPGLRSANGIALNKAGTHLWVTEYMGGNLHRFALKPSATVEGTSSVCYQFTGMHGPDSCSIDEDENLYVAMQGQGRVLVFNPYGIPIGQILLPDREKGKNLCCSSAMVAPGKREVYITSCDDSGEGPWIFKAGSYAVGNTTMYQFT